jgi:hypothetical protein
MGYAVQAQAEQVVGFVGVVDPLLQFVLDVAVQEPVNSGVACSAPWGRTRRR